VSASRPSILVLVALEEPPRAAVCALRASDACRVGTWALAQRDAIVAAVDEAIAAAAADCERHELGCACVSRRAA
jgi:hypothetical protein